MKATRVLSTLPEIALRIAADFFIVQIAMATALVLLMIQLRDTPQSPALIGLAVLRHYYLAVFLPLSSLFPIIYACCLLYHEARGYSNRSKLTRAAMSAAAGALIVIGISSLLPHSHVLSRRAAFIFSALVIIGTPGVRWLKHILFETELIRRPRAQRQAHGTVLVVGGAGYIGSIVVRKLLKRGFRVRVLDSLVYGASAIQDVLDDPRLDFVKGDCRDIKDVVGAIAGVRAIVHLAAIVGDPACEMDRKTAREINYAATRMLIEIAKGEQVERFVFASSCSVYGASEDIADETSPVGPISLYAETKVDSERELLAARDAEFHPTILRFATIFGLSPRPRFDLVVNLLAAKAMQEGLVTIYNGEQWRPFLHVVDAAEAIVRSLEAPISLVSGQIYNVGDSRLNYTLTSVAERILDAFPGTEIEHKDNSDRRNYRVSFEKIRQQLGFSCSKTLEQGIAELKQAFQAGQISDYRAPLYSNVKFLTEFGSPRQKRGVGALVMAALAEKA